MSDSESATVIVIVPVLTISANGLLEPLDDEPPDEDEDPPRLPAVEDPPASPEPPPAEELVEEELLLAVPVEPADTESPGERLASDTIVPLVGAYSLVSLSACSAVLTLASALSTDASAEAMLAGDGVVVVVVLDELEFDDPDEPEPWDPDEPEPDPDEPERDPDELGPEDSDELELDGRFDPDPRPDPGLEVDGVVVVREPEGVVLVGVVLVVGVVVVLLGLGFLVLLGDVFVRMSETNSTLDEDGSVRLVFVALEPPVPPAALEPPAPPAPAVEPPDDPVAVPSSTAVS